MCAQMELVAEQCPRQAHAVSPTASTPLQEPKPDAGTRPQHGPHANGNHNEHPAPEVVLKEVEEDAVPPIGDECQLPLDFAQAYNITAIRVLTTSQAPAW
jgi:hypothetical protein